MEDTAAKNIISCITLYLLNMANHSTDRCLSIMHILIICGLVLFLKGHGFKHMNLNPGCLKQIALCKLC